MRFIYFLTPLLLFLSASAVAENVSVAGDNVNMRKGPGMNYDVKISYDTGFPLKVTDRNGEWVKVRDFEGDEGWIYSTLVSDKRYVIVKNRGETALKSTPSEKSASVAKATYGVVLYTITAKEGWLKVKHESGIKGWIKQEAVWEGKN